MYQEVECSEECDSTEDDLKKLYYTEVNKSFTLAADFKETEL